MANDRFAITSPRSRALKNAKYEKYCRLRASAQPRIPAYREAGWETSDDDDAYSNACRLERRPGVRERIEYLSHQDEALIAVKRRRIEETLWQCACSWGLHQPLNDHRERERKRRALARLRLDPDLAAMHLDD